jgi:hypothetical protein
VADLSVVSFQPQALIGISDKFSHVRKLPEAVLTADAAFPRATATHYPVKGSILPTTFSRRKRPPFLARGSRKASQFNAISILGM